MRSIEALNISFSYNSKPFFSGLNFTVDQGELVALIGPNGSGKTTLINLIRGYLKPDKGKIIIFGSNLKQISRIEVGKLISLVPQESRTSFNFKAYDIVSMGRYPYHGISESNDMGNHEIIEQALQMTDSAKLADKYFWKLSGGEKQRVILSRAIAQQAPIVLLDEPTSSLDLKQAFNLYRVIKRLNEKSKLTIVAATHDVHLIKRFCHRAVMMKNGAIIGEGFPDTVFEKSTLASLYDIEDKEML